MKKQIPISYVGSAARADFSPDGALFMISGDRGFAKAWDWRSGDPAGPELIHPNAQAAFVPNTHSVLSVDQLSEVNGRINQVRLFDLPSGKLISPPIDLPGSGLWGLAITPDGKYAVVAEIGSQHGFHIIDLEKLQQNAPFANLDDDELIRYAELSVGAILEKGSPVHLQDQEWLKLWQATERQGPEKPSPAK